MRFFELFSAIPSYHYKGQRMCFLGGVRAEESPRRYLAMTEDLTYKDITWGKQLSKKEEHYTFYPVYDWSYTDVWKAIHDNKWPYTKVYDYQYMHGVHIRSMRVSNLHHETALEVLQYLQEVEQETWAKLTRRMSGINTAGVMKKEYFVKQLPFMFKDWAEYRDYLTDHLIQNEKVKEKFKKTWKRQAEIFDGMNHIEDLHKAQVRTILANDEDLTKLKNFTERPDILNWKKWKKGITTKWTEGNKYIFG
jgi:predicted phosphoadenosine phosphosulfate sulfurtransferase